MEEKQRKELFNERKLQNEIKSEIFNELFHTLFKFKLHFFFKLKFETQMAWVIDGSRCLIVKTMCDPSMTHAVR